jgi:hypothetical protein
MSILLLLVCVGCGSSGVAPVSGTVMLDGKPLETGAIMTLPEAGRGAQGRIQNGRFQLSTFGTNDGALLGTHKVAVSASEPSRGSGPEAQVGKLLVPQRYTNPDASGLTIDVQRGNNEVELRLSTKE